MKMESELDWRVSEQPHYVSTDTIADILSENRQALIDLVAETYRAFYDGDAINPDTYSLKFPQKSNSRINALPAYVGKRVNLAGLKWVGSFPDNVALNKQRASAVIILNSFTTGYPVAILDGTLISAARTAASAALAARLLIPSKTSDDFAIVGAGVINRELMSFLLDDGWTFSNLQIHDLNPDNRQAFETFFSSYQLPFRTSESIEEVNECGLISMATTALEPWYHLDIPSGQTVLHISLRDILPQNLAGGVRNIVDDVIHALKGNTSLHLLEQNEGSVPNIENYSAILREEPTNDTPTVVSAFGMGILDIAVAEFVMTQAQLRGDIRRIDGMLPGMDRW